MLLQRSNGRCLGLHFRFTETARLNCSISRKIQQSNNKNAQLFSYIFTEDNKSKLAFYHLFSLRTLLPNLISFQLYNNFFCQFSRYYGPLVSCTWIVTRIAVAGAVQSLGCLSYCYGKEIRYIRVGRPFTKETAANVHNRLYYIPWLIRNSCF